MTLSTDLYARASGLIPGGVNSPVRAFNGVGGKPLFIKRGQGSHIFDVDGQAYIDYVCSWGPLILGHAHSFVVEKVTAAIANGSSFGAPTEVEVALAETILAHMPAIEQIRFVSSGTEAAMSAIRLARGFTGRNKILKFTGCYHGHADSLLVAAGSGNLTFGVPSSAGVPASVAQDTLVADFNDLASVKAIFAEYGDQIAAIIVEPIAANMNLVLPSPEFLPGLRAICTQYGALLIMDEVVTGFRLGLGGAQALFNIDPDLTVLGKIIGGGFPAAAFGGKAAIMAYLAPLGPVYQAGTLSGNPIAMTAGLATLEWIAKDPGFYDKLATKTQTLVQGLQAVANQAQIPFTAKAIGSLFGLFFTHDQKIDNEADVKRGNVALFKRFFHAMLENGVYLAPSAYEVGFLSAAHTDEDIARTIAAAAEVMSAVVA